MFRHLTTDRTEGRNRFYWEKPGDHDNVVVVFKNRTGGISIAVSEEMPVDSYNETFECSAFLDPSDAMRLRDYLNTEFPR